MTREEALNYAIVKVLSLEHGRELVGDECKSKFQDELDFYHAVIRNLRPITKEQKEKIFSGCDFCNVADFGEYGFEISKHYAKIGCALGSWRFSKKDQFLFCPKCGKPLTDNAVEIMMKRLEEMQND